MRTIAPIVFWLAMQLTSPKLAFAAENRSERDYVSILSIAGTYLSRGRYQLALELVDQGRSDMPGLDQDPFLNFIASKALYGLGNYGQSLASLDSLSSALERNQDIERFDPKSGTGQFLARAREELPVSVSIWKAKCYLRLGQIDRGLAEAREVESALSLWTGSLGINVVNALELATELSIVGETAAAEKLLSKVEGAVSAFSAVNSFAIIGRVGSSEMDKFRLELEATANGTRGRIAFQLLKYAEALPLLRMSDKYLADKSSFYSDASLDLKYRITHSLNRLGMYEDAVAALPKEFFDVSSNEATDSAALAGLDAEVGYSLFRLKRFDEAIPRWERLVHQLEVRRSAILLPPNAKQHIFGQWVPFYRILASQHLRSGQTSRGFELSELSKARTLLESIAVGNADDTNILPADKRAQLKELGSKLAAFHSQLLTTNDPTLTKELTREHESVSAKLQSLRQELFKTYPKYEALNKISIVSRAGPNLLPFGTVFISYMLVPRDVYEPSWSNSDLYAFILKGDGNAPRVVSLGDFGELDTGVKQYLGALALGDAEQRNLSIVGAGSANESMSMEKPGTGAAMQGSLSVAQILSQKLLAPILNEISDAQTLIISPDGPLALLPFETLPINDGRLVSRFDVSYIQSLSVLSLLRDRQREYEAISRRSLFAMGAAFYEGAKPLAAPASISNTLTDNRNLRAAYAIDRNNPHRTVSVFDALKVRLPNLPGTEKEIRNVSKMFSDSSIYIKENATEAKLLELNKTKELANYRYLLFSAHGYLSTEVPELSALVLGLVDKAPGTDGFITAAKWPGYTVKSDLIVLSACQTGVGKLVLGEGVMGLPYALYVAGNRSTVLSLWAVDDDGTALFMEIFFSHLKAGKSQSEAINATKRDLIKRSDFGSPFYWAPFVMYGG